MKEPVLPNQLPDNKLFDMQNKPKWKCLS